MDLRPDLVAGHLWGPGVEGRLGVVLDQELDRLCDDRSRDDVLPWDIIDGGMKDDFFRAEAEKAMRAEWTLPPKRQKENARLLAVLQDVS